MVGKIYEKANEKPVAGYILTADEDGYALYNSKKVDAETLQRMFFVGVWLFDGDDDYTAATKLNVETGYADIVFGETTVYSTEYTAE